MLQWLKYLSMQVFLIHLPHYLACQLRQMHVFFFLSLLLIGGRTQDGFAPDLLLMLGHGYYLREYRGGLLYLLIDLLLNNSVFFLLKAVHELLETLLLLVHVHQTIPDLAQRGRTGVQLYR
jgi:hypothetical protein